MPKIMIVDDDATIQMEMEEYLNHMDYTVVGISGTGSGAVEMAGEMKPDLILMDVNLPGEMNGIEAAEKIKAELDIPIIFISGYGDPAYIEKAKEIEPFGYVMKPFDEEEIRAFIEIALHKRAMELKLRKANERLEQANRDLKQEIEERKQAEGALRESEERFRTLFEEVPIPIQGYGPDGTIHYWNSASENSYGYKKEEAVGKDIVELIVPPEMRDVMRNVIKSSAGTGEMPPSEELLLMRKDCSRVPVFSSHAVLERSGKAPEFFCFDVDLTEHKRLQNQLQKAVKMEAIATLAGGVAHEFNNALMGIMGNIELLKMNFPEAERSEKNLNAMKRSGQRMTRLTDQLLAYAEGGKYQPKNLRLDDFVIETLPILQHDLSPTIRVETHFPKDISYINADNAQMQMVLSAILANSNEAVEDEGFIRITVENKDVDDDFTKQSPGLKPGSYVCLTIEDDGKGMDEETRNGIFEPFFSTKFQGRGMGMAAVYGIVKSHDGWIYVDSESGKGTTVRVYLPAIEIDIEKPKKIKAEVAMGSGTILMIEDEYVVIEVTRVMLEKLGYRVMVAKTGKDAIHIAETFDGRIDLALLDRKLPDIDGRTLYPLIMKARSNLKVIVFSGSSIDGPAREILDAGAQDFIQKPFSLATLSEKLKEVLEGKQVIKSAQFL